MLFTSYEFVLVFLPCVLLLVWGASALGQRGIAKVLLFGASLVFYAWWNPRYVLLLIALLGFNFAIGSWLIRTRSQTELSRQRRAALVFGIAANVGTLIYFKYTNFFVLELDKVFGWSFDLAPILLPLGISFMVFQKVAFLVDSYGSDIKRLSFLDYGLFVSFFPQLISGPIVHHSEIIPQLESSKTLRYAARVMPIAISFFIFGAFKKVIVADSLSPYVATAFHSSASSHVGFFNAWTGALAYTFQVYFDFSGYSDIAIGLGLMFGMRLPFNFNSPLKASGPIDYWGRWHITLTRFLTAYIYNPLALRATRRRIAKRKPLRVDGVMSMAAFVRLLAVPTMITMFIAGAWHGAGYQFVVFGLIHGTYLVANHAWRNLRALPDDDDVKPSSRARLVSRAAMFVAVVVAIPFFRADSVRHAWNHVTSMFGSGGFDARSLGDYRFLAILMLCLVATQLLPNTQEILGERLDVVTETPVEHPGATAVSRAWSWPRLTWRPTVTWAVALGLIAWYVLLQMARTSEFLYFQF